MSISPPETKCSETLHLKTTAPIKSNKYNEGGFLISMLSDPCTIGAGFEIAKDVVKKQTCKDISMMLERCILDGHDCKTNLYKFNVMCKGDIDTKL